MKLGCSFLLAASACAARPPSSPATCPTPFAADPARQGRIVAITGTDPEARDLVRGLPSACFGLSRSIGVLVEGRPMLDAHASDDELAARLAHLGVHLHDDVGDGCRRGRAHAIASEGRARAIENRLRARVGLPVADDPHDAIADYTSRCERP